jgi:hypothetical protein
VISFNRLKKLKKRDIMTLIDGINIGFSIIGAITFILALHYEFKTNKLFGRIKKAGKWKFAVV